MDPLGRVLRHDAALSRDEPEMEGLVDDMAVYLTQCRSDATVKKYDGYFKRFASFMERNSRKSLPARSIDVALYITNLLNCKSSHSVVSSSVYSIKYMHSLFGYEDPTVGSHVQHLLDTSKRVGYKPVNKKDVVTSDMIKNLFILYKDTSDLFILRDLAMIIVSYCGFLRYDELSNVRCKDVELVSNSHVEIYIVKSKTDQYREGDRVLLSKLDSESCPYNCLSRYISLANIDSKSSDFLFKALYKTKSGVGFRKKCQKLSYTRTRELLITRLREVCGGFNLGLHSLRAGGATAAANAGVNDRCWRRHGRWKRDAAHGYVKDKLADRLSVSQNLGL